MKIAFTAILIVAAACWACSAALDASANDRGSDIIRQWTVCQYVNDGRDPYSLSKDVLVANYGVGNPSQAKLYAIPTTIPSDRQADVLAQFGPPEATYPPPAIGLLASTIGLLPRTATLWIWFAFNILLMGCVALRLVRIWDSPPGGGSSRDNLRLVLAAMFLFPAAYTTMVSGQFSLLVLYLLLIGTDSKMANLPRGLALGIALLKPSITLPFMFLPLVRREWRVLGIAAAVQALAGGYVSFRTGETIGLIHDWISVAGFFLGGVYTLQEWLNPITAQARWLIPAVMVCLLLFCAITLTAGRNLPPARLFSLAAITSIFWTYHGVYDFIMLLPVLLPLIGWSDQRSSSRWSAIGLAVFALLAVALIPQVMRGADPATRSIRWATRLAVITLFAREYVLIYWSLFTTPRATPQPV